MEIHLIILSPFLIVFSIGMLITSVVSYHRSHNPKLVFISIVFLIFLIRALILAFSLIYIELMGFTSFFSIGLLDLLILLLLFLATIKRWTYD